MPCLVNLFGTVKRVAMGVTLEGKRAHHRRRAARGGRAAGLPAPARAAARPEGRLGHAAAGQDGDGACGPRCVKTAPVQEVVLKGDQIDLTKLPIQTCWPGEPAPLITWPLVVTKGPSDDREDDFNLGIYRMQVLGKDRTIMRWLAHRGGAQHHRRWKKAGKREPLPACAVHRRRSGHHPGRRDAGAGHPVGIPVRRPAARRQGSTWSRPRPCR